MSRPRTAHTLLSIALATLLTAAGVQEPAACTFFSQDELEKTVGWQLQKAKKQKDAPPGQSACDFSVARSDADRAKAREVMVALAKPGAKRLGW